jgi:hypothetical protein
MALEKSERVRYYNTLRPAKRIYYETALADSHYQAIKAACIDRLNDAGRFSFHQILKSLNLHSVADVHWGFIIRMVEEEHNTKLLLVSKWTSDNGTPVLAGMAGSKRPVGCVMVDERNADIVAKKIDHRNGSLIRSVEKTGEITAAAKRAGATIQAPKFKEAHIDFPKLL